MKANEFIKKKFPLPFRYKLSILFIQLNSSTNLCVHFYQRSLLFYFSSLMSKQSISLQVVRSYYLCESEILKWYLTSWGQGWDTQLEDLPAMLSEEEYLTNQMFSYINQPCTLSFPNGLFEIAPEILGQPKLTKNTGGICGS